MVTRVKEGYRLKLKDYLLFTSNLNIIFDTLDFLKLGVSEACLPHIKNLEVNQTIILQRER